MIFKSASTFCQHRLYSYFLLLPAAASELADHDSYLHFRSQNIDLSIDLDTKWKDSKTVDSETNTRDTDRDKPEILLYRYVARNCSKNNLNI